MAHRPRQSTLRQTPHRQRHHLLRQLLTGAVVVLLLWWVARTVSWRATWQTLTNLAPLDLLWLTAANLAVFATFTARWWLFLRSQGHQIPYLQLVRYRLTAFGISYFTPGPHFGGEPYQVYIVVRRHNVPVADAVAAVALDKLLEMLVNFAFLAGGVLVVALSHQALPPGLERQLTVYALILLALPGLALALLMLGRRPITGTLHWFSRLWPRRPLSSDSPPELPRWRDALQRSETQAIWLCQTHPATVWAAIGVSVLSWLGVVGEFWLLTRLLDLPLRFTEALNALVAARLAILLPLPAALGVLEAGQALAMTSLGLPPAYGASLALLIRARDVMMGIAGLLIGGTQVWPWHAADLGRDDAKRAPQPLGLNVSVATMQSTATSNETPLQKQQQSTG